MFKTCPGYNISAGQVRSPQYGFMKDGSTQNGICDFGPLPFLCFCLARPVLAFVVLLGEPSACMELVKGKIPVDFVYS